MEGVSSQQKAAAIIISLGSEKASAVYKFLKDDEIEQLTIEIAKLDHLSPQEMQEIIGDFHKLCITQKVLAEGGVDYARDVLEKAFGQQTALSLMERVSRNLKTKSFDFLRKTDYKNLYALIQNEHPQTMALILSYSSADQASHIIAELSPEKKVDVVKRI
ncbi:MAG: flagellar motor switch protein FliG, partial [Oscillospiraceae bacterium]